MKDIMPINKNQEYELAINDLGSNGEGIGRIDGFALFINGALPGERVKVKVLKVLKNYAFAKLIEVIIPSPDRIVPPCKVFEKCGGCNFQHLDYSAQLKYKTKIVHDALVRIGGVEAPIVHDTIGMQNPWKYRNKGQFPVVAGNGELAIGLFAQGTHRVVDIDTCLIQNDISDTIISIMREYCKNFGVSVYDEKTKKGVLRHIVTRVSKENKEIMLILVTNEENLPFCDKLVHRVRNALPNVSSIVQNINKKDTNVVLGTKNKTIWGEPYIYDTIDDLRFRISPLSFFQVNPLQTAVLYGKALEYANLDGTQTLLDLFCGIGTISLFLARKAKFVYGIEEVPDAIEDAKENAKLNKIKNVEFLCEDANKALLNQSTGEKIDVVVLDPPRKGCEPELLSSIVKLSPERIVYVSCNPATLARDVKYLSQGGYELKEAQPVDMFPHTGHVETVVLMSRVK